MHITEILSRSAVVHFTRFADKPQLLKELAKRAAAALDLDPASVTEEIMRREQLGSTGVGDAVAIPHARIEGVIKPFGILCRLEEPLEFESVDGVPVDIVFFLLLPKATSGQQLAALACVTRQLRNAEVVSGIRNGAGTAEIYDAITRGA